MTSVFTSLLFLAALFLWLPSAAFAGPVVAELSSDEVAITTDFNGQDLLLFGAVTPSDDNDIIVILTGPQAEFASRRKEQVSGIWINRQTVTWKNAPSFYQVLSTRPVDQILSEKDRKALKVGYQNLGLKPRYSKLSETELAEWMEALNRNMQQAGLWHEQSGAVEIIRNALFRAPVTLPANIIPGDYRVRILDVQNGRLVSEDETSLSVQKQGVGAQIYRLAHEYSIFYGLFAVAFAVAAGWLASAAFRK